MPAKLGQHFLKNETAIRNIVAALEIRSGDTIIEIGPGAGALTFPLAKECGTFGSRLIAIERDKKLIEHLQKELPNDLVEILSGDAIKVLPSLVAERALKAGRFKIVGNIPYYITGKLLRVLSELPSKPERTVLMIQKEVAQRLSSQSPEMNLLAAAVQFWAEPKTLFYLKPKEFVPPPEVDSAVIRLITKKQAPPVEPVEYFAFIRIAFKQPRKTLLNNLSADGSLSKNETASLLASLGLKEGIRPQDLSLNQLCALANRFRA